MYQEKRMDGMKNNGKMIQYANFNITFGEDSMPMLELFDEIMMPAFTSSILKRGKDTDRSRYAFNEVNVKEFNGDYILCGNIIKDTKLERYTTLSPNMILESSPAQMETAPYSRFIIFLENHRMLLVRNEADSPDIRSFQATVREILAQYTKTQNKVKKDDELLPYAVVNIVDIPLSSDIDSILQNVVKIKNVRWRFFPLNGDINYGAMFKEIGSFRMGLGSPNAYLSCTSPKSKKALQDAMNDTVGKGLAEVRLEVIDNNGKRSMIKEDNFTTSERVDISGDISNKDDEHLVSIAKDVPELQRKTEGNTNIYNRFMYKIRKWVNK
jgi:hypothetical protein